MSSSDLKSLFQLAKSVNAVETIYVGTNQNAHGSSKYSTQSFRYIIAMDFEATCWPKETQQWKANEIIEFPAVLLNFGNGKIESEFRQYVMPIENPRLSDFCRALTGIRQEDVNAGVPLHTCLFLFDKWLKQILSERKLVLPKTDANNQHGDVAFATWSDWDFGTCLHNECTRKQTKKPSYFEQWVDVRAMVTGINRHSKQLQQKQPLRKSVVG
ncbi:ERI1 exoribonuclease 2-like [Toxorhynchites rutilus septentrionalis]|uniref:ERI1 exoribonuclease 2-like n=1 Tax=Toxorhynchites rutilus septentrionalis TaxID=329112 RepID=UPI00247AC2FC|nr:ERI1 exoribonuclease 2-like [Toxorhynchites rutilus septentrionalis]